MNTSDQQLIQALKNGDNEALSIIYTNYRLEFIKWLKAKYRCDELQATELYQGIILQLYENVTRQDRSFTLKSKLKTYLFSIGRNNFLETKRVKDRQLKIDRLFLVEQINSQENKSQQEDELRLQQLRLVAEALNELKPRCRKLLEYFYYDELQFNDILKLMDYKNRDSIKMAKYKCFKKLQKLYQEKSVNYE